jgi:hypothetical protein
MGDLYALWRPRGRVSWEHGWERGGNKSSPLVAARVHRCQFRNAVSAGDSWWEQDCRARRVTSWMAAALKRTSTPGVYVRGSRWVAVYLEDGRQRRRAAPTFRPAREIKVRATERDAARRA